MAKKSFTRREFLKTSAWGTAALTSHTLVGCSTLDRYFMGDTRDLRQEVIILGAGAAGLTAAFELKKKKIPFRIFEASSRVGGRVQSTSVFAQGGLVAELGAEFFDDSHAQLFKILKELNIPAKEVKASGKAEPHFFSFNKKVYRSRDIAARLRSLEGPLQRVRADLFRSQQPVLNYKNSLQYERSLYYDSLSLQDLLDSWKTEVDPVILQLIAVQASSRFGVEASAQSSLHFLSTVDAEGSSLLSARPLYRVEGGLSHLTQALALRVAGVIPDYVLKMNHALTEISEDREVFKLTFATPRGKETFTTRQVICTLPFSALRQVRGISDLDFSSLKKENIANQAYGTHSKGAAVFATPFWNSRRGQMPENWGNFTGNFLTEKMWDAGRGQSVSEGHGLLAFQRSGDSGVKTGAEAVDEAQRDLQLFYSDVPTADRSADIVANWSQRKWAGGSMAVFKPGQYMRFKGAAGESEYQGRFLFAGEHTSLRFAGTLEGAVESGLKAASEIQI
ncbi:MAG: NAD(P)/FAD-dependent oxidoreductase [Bdellovibrio sp.]